MEEKSYVIRRAIAEDAELIVSLFRETYGDKYPHAEMYRPEVLQKRIDKKDVQALLASAPDGRPVGYFAREKTAPNPNLWEEKGLVVVPDYKQTSVGLELMNRMQEADFISGSGVFSFPVCYQYFSQLACVKHGRSDVALCLDLVEGSIFKERQAGQGRVACLLNFSEYTAPSEPMYLPDVYAEMLRELAAPLQKRVFKEAVGCLPAEGKTVLEAPGLPEAGSWSVAVREVGADWPQCLQELVAQAQRQQVISLRFIINAHRAAAGAAVEELRQQGFFFGGLAPRWFGSDGIIVQKIFHKEPDFAGIRLYSQQAKELCSFIRADRKAVQRIHAEKR